LQNPPDVNGQIGQPALVDQLLGQQRSGFFIECGANDGEFISNTLFFELERNWTGLLIEADHDLFQQLISKNRKAYSINACLSGTNMSSQAVFSKTYYRIGGPVGVYDPASQFMRDNFKAFKNVTVQCFPFYSVMLAIGMARCWLLRTHMEMN